MDFDSYNRFIETCSHTSKAQTLRGYSMTFLPRFPKKSMTKFTFSCWSVCSVYFVKCNFLLEERQDPSFDVIIMERHVNTKPATTQLQMVFCSPLQQIYLRSNPVKSLSNVRKAPSDHFLNQQIQHLKTFITKQSRETGGTIS